MNDVIILGQKKYKENVIAEKVKVAGHGCFLKGLQAANAYVSGVFTVGGKTSINHLKNRGHFKSRELEAFTVDSKGFMKIDGHAAVNEQFFSKGVLTIGGMLCARNISIKSGALSKRGWGRRSKCYQVKGDTIEMEAVAADSVEGNVVRIGARCVVGELRYGEHCEVHPTSIVKKVTKAGGNPWLNLNNVRHYGKRVE
ncbi:hypothetical protein [Fictibacillus fluitans]|uniref:Uncharacterized protein n=1 Tax=Fictibacillus fluitans TaxID=3058422 RepID=A0ABT8HTB9_9BACL|nr:hypothetical protein [Fictibacillus sp. NE201]MDN4524022.1 hypothetical protein [Fictibacillus sp. NE201]